MTKQKKYDRALTAGRAYSHARCRTTADVKAMANSDHGLRRCHWGQHAWLFCAMLTLERIFSQDRGWVDRIGGDGPKHAWVVFPLGTCLDFGLTCRRVCVCNNNNNNDV